MDKVLSSEFHGEEKEEVRIHEDGAKRDGLT
jgi:hypothetical protein